MYEWIDKMKQKGKYQRTWSFASKIKWINIKNEVSALIFFRKNSYCTPSHESNVCILNYQKYSLFCLFICLAKVFMQTSFYKIAKCINRHYKSFNFDIESFW